MQRDVYVLSINTDKWVFKQVDVVLLLKTRRHAANKPNWN